jgi:hypothetical protein
MAAAGWTRRPTLNGSDVTWVANGKGGLETSPVQQLRSTGCPNGFLTFTRLLNAPRSRSNTLADRKQTATSDH